MRRGPEWPDRLSELKGRKVRTRFDLRNGYVTIPAGSILTLNQATRWSGLRGSAPKCEHCGMAPLIGGLSPSDLELLPKEESSNG